MELALRAVEESTYIVRVSFTDDAGEAVTPNSATWTLSDADGDIINSREEVAITPLSTSADIVLYGDDLAIGTNGTERKLIVEAEYDSSAGSGLPMKGEVTFYIDDLLNVS
jgi:hypothetical protein